MGLNSKEEGVDTENDTPELDDSAEEYVRRMGERSMVEENQWLAKVKEDAIKYSNYSREGSSSTFLALEKVVEAAIKSQDLLRTAAFGDPIVDAAFDYITNALSELPSDWKEMLEKGSYYCPSNNSPHKHGKWCEQNG